MRTPTSLHSIHSSPVACPSDASSRQRPVERSVCGTPLMTPSSTSQPVEFVSQSGHSPIWESALLQAPLIKLGQVWYSWHSIYGRFDSSELAEFDAARNRPTANKIQCDGQLSPHDLDSYRSIESAIRLWKEHRHQTGTVSVD
ncbi:hypothetical protein IV203_031267 [Nitzschia inconspicua]|uniref:Uncharacterized protein n=1 Tax=Nitzschia inconspicua TaxID=303405 RepID=A0A9K3LTX6_9STRA|nr:hypothetical protein IV203_031267 [Nitzschia inconspicua]